MIPLAPLAGQAPDMPQQARSSRLAPTAARRPSATPELALSHVQDRSHAVSKHRPAARDQAVDTRVIISAYQTENER